MAKSLLRTDKELAELYERYLKTVYCVCFAFMKNAPDTEDMVQETFVRLLRRERAFEGAAHEKAWLIRTASNLCKNSLKHWWRKRENLEDHAELRSEGSWAGEETEMILCLPDKYKTVVFMYYYDPDIIGLS